MQIYNSNENFLPVLALISSKSHSLSNKTPNSRLMKPSFELFVRLAQRISKILSAICLSLCCLTEVKVIALLLKAPHISELKEWKPPTILPCCDTYEL